MTEFCFECGAKLEGIGEDEESYLCPNCGAEYCIDEAENGEYSIIRGLNT